MKKSIQCCLASFVVMLLAGMPVFASAAEFYVAPVGRDDADGTQAHPFATLSRARDAVRQLRKDEPHLTKPVMVWIRGGDYSFDKSVHFGQEDSGTDDSPTYYAAWPGEHVRFIGGAILPPDSFEPITNEAVLKRIPAEASKHVMQLDLRKRNLNDYGTLQGLPPYQILGMTAEAELFFNDCRMTLARWPNGDYARTPQNSTPPAQPSRDAATKKNVAIAYEGNRPERWREAKDAWIGGYFDQDWLYRVMRIDSYDLEHRLIYLPSDAGISLKTDGPARRYFCYNLLEELDQPGEYWLDREQGMLYFYPPSAVLNAQTTLSTLAQPFLIMKNVSHVTVRGITMTAARNNGMEIRDGNSVSIEQCTFENLGGSGVLALGGKNHSIKRCEIAATGSAGLIINGGDPKTLAPCGHIVSDNHIHHIAGRKRAYAPGIQACDIIGAKFTNNHIHDVPHSAIMLNGNDNIVELNEIDHAVQEANDIGAISSGGGWQYRGNAIVRNYIHHVRGVEGHSIRAPGVYLDMIGSGMTLTGNIFHQCDIGIFIHSGRNNSVENNLIVDCALSIQVADSSKKSWHNEMMRQYCRPMLIEYYDNPAYHKYPCFSAMLGELPALPFDSATLSRAAYATELANYLNEHLDIGAVWETPKYNAVCRNAMVRSPEPCLADAAKEFGTMEGNLTLDAKTDPGFANPSNRDFTLKSDSPILRSLPQFQTVSLPSIGPRGPTGAYGVCKEPIASECVQSLRVRLPEPHDPEMEKVLAIFSRQVTSRCDAHVTTTEESPLVIEFAVEPGVGKDGFTIADAGDKAIRITGNDRRGLIYGVGKFLRSSRYDACGFTPGAWRGTSVPKSTFRGVYLATHFGNFYEAASAEEIQRYLEDLTLWGLNAVAVHFPAWQFKGFDDPAARKNIERLRLVLQTAKNMGLEVALLEAWNGGFASAPKDIWAVDFADWHGGGYAGRNICPSNPAGRDYLAKLNGQLLNEFADIGMDYVVHWPYDEGGCGCEQCRPWGAGGYLVLSKDVTQQARTKFPGCKSILSTWCYGYPAKKWMYDPKDTEEWEGLNRVLAQDKSWVDYIMADAHEDFPPYPLQHGVPGGLPMLNFPEISMWGQTPWGGYGANPFPTRLQRFWNQTNGKLSGGLPYSEGVYDDLNKVTCLQLYWEPDRPVVDTMREYAAFEYGPDAAEDVSRALEIIENNHEREKITSSAIDAFQILDKVDAKLTAHARNAWRWQILYLRAMMDQELYRNELDQAHEKVFERIANELADIYHLQNVAGNVIQPARIQKGKQPTK